MPKKSAEGSFSTLVRSMGWFSHKYGDVRYCISCKAPQPKTERAPDYAIAPIYTWVECKNNDSTGLWHWKDDIGPEGIRKNQRYWLTENGGWLYIELGRGKMPDGRQAWLIPWKHWIEAIEPVLLEREFYSLRFSAIGEPHHLNYRPPAMETLGARYALVWIRGSGWIVPDGHDFWKALVKQLEIQLTLVRNRL